MKLIITALMALTFLGCVARADETRVMTLADLQEFCTASDDVGKSVCRIYILGISQGIGMGAAMVRGEVEGPPCTPDNTSGLALETAVKIAMGQDLMLFPDDKKMPAASFVAGALVKSFPCHSKSN